MKGQTPRPKFSRKEGLEEALKAKPRDAKEAALLDALKGILAMSQSRARMYGMDQYGINAQEGIKRWSVL